MVYILRDRHFLKLLDFTPEEISFLLGLSLDLKKSKYSGTKQPRSSGKKSSRIFEKGSTHTRDYNLLGIGRPNPIGVLDEFVKEYKFG